MSARTNRRVLRNLDHLWQGTRNKFANKMTPSHARTTPPFVPRKDRIAFWNIVPGDYVRVRNGAIGHDENGHKIRGEGIVASIDRTTNRVWLRDPDVRRATDRRTSRSARRKISSTSSPAWSTPRRARTRASPPTS